MSTPSAPMEPVNGARSEQGGPPAKTRLADVFALVGDSDVSDAELRLWLHYRQHHIGDRGAFISDAATTTALGWSARKLQDVRASLVRHALLVVVPRGPRPPARYPCHHPQASQPGVTQASQSGVRQQGLASQSDVTQASRSDVTQQELGSHVGSHVGSHSTACPIDEPRKPVNRKAYTQIETDFDDFWSGYPKRAGDKAKKGALTNYRARRKEGVTREALITGRDRYQRFIEATGKVGTEYVKQAKTWLAPKCEGWLQSWDLPADTAATAPAFADYPEPLR